jgi:hypothetical protein
MPRIHSRPTIYLFALLETNQCPLQCKYQIFVNKMQLDSDLDEENGQEDEERSIDDNASFEPFQWELCAKHWYWGSTSKEVLAIAMQV